MRWYLSLIALFASLSVLLTYWPENLQPLIENVYGSAIYPALQAVFSLLPSPRFFAIADLLWVLVPILFILRIVILVRGNVIHRVPRVCLETLLWISAGYLLFMLLWGINYQRPSLYHHLSEQGFTTKLHDGHWQFALDQTNTTLNALPESFDYCESANLLFSPERPAAFVHSATALAALPVSPNRAVKASRWSGVYSGLGIAGVYIPFTGEPTFNNQSFLLAQPFIMTHEFSHWAGAAREYDADILAYWALWLSPDPVWQYSAWLSWWFDISPPDNIVQRLPTNLRVSIICYQKHLKAQKRWQIRHSFWRVYEANLVNQGVEEGLVSYKMGESMALTSYQDWLYKKARRQINQ